MSKSPSSKPDANLKRLTPYENQWVALSPDKKKVLANGRTLDRVRRSLSAKERADAYFVRVLPFDIGYAP